MTLETTARRRLARTPLVAIALVATLLATASPLQAASDRDGDGLEDRYERLTSKTDPRQRDSDGDLLDDGFETRWGVTDPNKRDSDGDGVLDSLEDDDQDHLSNRGEQRYGTDPTAADTDSDGIRDGADDIDENGVRDALEQDRRRLPRRLIPTVVNAQDDLAKDGNGCHTGATSGYIYTCVYGDTAGRLKVALFGDSHALQWLPALDRAGEKHGWRVTALTKSACPSAAVLLKRGSRRVSALCNQWRNSAKAWLRSNPQDVVLLSNNGRYSLVDGRGRSLHRDEKEKRWKRGLAKTIKAMPKRTKVVVISDTPHMIKDPQRCLQAAGKYISDCQSRRAAAILASHDDAERRVAESLGASFADLNRVVCPYDPCPIVSGETVMWRDRAHLTATYSEQLAPAMHKVVRAALRRKAQPFDAVAVSAGLAPATAAVVVHDDFFEPDVLEAEHGVELEMIFTNVGKTPHRISLYKADGETPLVDDAKGSLLRRGRTTEIILADLEPGEYIFQSDGRSPELTGTLVVR